MRNLLLAVALGLVSTSALAAAGHGEGSQDVSDADIDRTITVETGDLWFKPDDLSIAPGETVKFVIENTGNLVHEFVIGNADEQAEHREMMQQMASNGGGHDMSAGHHSGMQAMPSVTVAAGETKTLVWTAPETSNAALVYACNIPGHFEAGMRGELVVQG
tara:strand:- start:99 stop:581 length:483 start_codon:yes stop_codon:yes gene_type:complete